MTEQADSLYKIQQANSVLTTRYAAKLVVNPHLDRRLVSFQANKGEIGNRWYKYKEGFSAALMRYAFDKVGLAAGTLLEPFAGAGTALFAASAAGMNAVGIELLPSSAETIAARQLLLKTDSPRMIEAVRLFRAGRSWEQEGATVPFAHLNITKGAFPQETERQLGRYLYEASCHSNADVGRILHFAALCVLEAISYTRKDGQYLRWDYRSGRRQGSRPFDKGKILTFSEAIQPKLLEIETDLCADSLPSSLFDEELSGQAQSPGEIQLLTGSCLDILPTLKRDSFDGIVTSPPYANRYDYTRTYALELAMMGVDETGIRQLRQSMLSCTVENKAKDNLSERFSADVYNAAQIAFESQEALQRILAYLEQCKSDKTINNTGIPRMVRNYFWEMALIIFQCARLLKPGAPFVMVNDNVRYMGAHVPVDLILADFAVAAGLDVETIWVLPCGKGNSSQQMGEHGREEARKCVYVWRRPTNQ